MPTLVPSLAPSYVDEFSLSTTFDSNTANDGVMFDVVAITNCTIRSLSIHTSVSYLTVVDVYGRYGTWIGRDKHPKAWTMILNAAVTLNGIGLPSALPSFAKPIHLTTGKRYGFYTTFQNGNSMLMTAVDGTYQSGDIYKQSEELRLFVGAGKNHRFLHIRQNVVWNGIVHYTALPIEKRESIQVTSGVSRNESSIYLILLVSSLLALSS